LLLIVAFADQQARRAVAARFDVDEDPTLPSAFINAARPFMPHSLRAP
jgi:hypothetical protein